MRAQDIKTGMIGLVCRPDLKTLTGIGEEAIAKLTPSERFDIYYHVMWLYRDAEDRVRVSEMVMPSWRDISLEERIADLDGELHIGTLPWVVSGQPQKLMDFLDWFASQPHLHPYGDESLIPTGISNDFGVHMDPFKMRLVCSLLVEWGVLTIEHGDIDQLWAPNHCAEFCDSIEIYEGGSK